MRTARWQRCCWHADPQTTDHERGDEESKTNSPSHPAYLKACTKLEFATEEPHDVVMAESTVSILLIAPPTCAPPTSWTKQQQDPPLLLPQKSSRYSGRRSDSAVPLALLKIKVSVAFEILRPGNKERVVVDRSDPQWFGLEPFSRMW